MAKRTLRYDSADPTDVKHALRDLLANANAAGLKVSMGLARSYVKVEGPRPRRPRKATGKGQTTSRLWEPGGALREADNRRKAARGR
jgi:hypothetical protein